MTIRNNNKLRTKQQQTNIKNNSDNIQQQHFYHPLLVRRRKLSSAKTTRPFRSGSSAQSLGRRPRKPRLSSILADPCRSLQTLWRATAVKRRSSRPDGRRQDGRVTTGNRCPATDGEKKERIWVTRQIAKTDRQIIAKWNGDWDAFAIWIVATVDSAMEKTFPDPVFNSIFERFHVWSIHLIFCTNKYDIYWVLPS